MIDHAPRFIGAERAGQQLFGEVHAALVGVLPGDGHLIKLLQNLLGLLARKRSQPRHLVGQPVNLFLRQVAQQFGAGFLAERDQKNRRFAKRRKPFRLWGCW
jgi:hypothetical protein